MDSITALLIYNQLFFLLVVAYARLKTPREMLYRRVSR